MLFRSEDAAQFFDHLDALLVAPPVRITPGANGSMIFERVSSVTGPMSVFEDDYLRVHYSGPPARLLSYEGLRGEGSEYAYEVLNGVNGQRTAQAIRDLVSAEYGPVPLDVVIEYLEVLEKAGVVRRK